MWLRSKVAVITGGASGIDGAGTEVFSNEGAEVIILDVNQTAGSLLEQSLRTR